MGAQAPTIGTLLGHYRLLERIGQGGMGVVFRARDEQLERDVAVKILPPGTFPDEQARKRFRREARVLGRLNHPNVAMAFDFGQQDTIDYLVTEYVGGVSLDAKVACGPLPQKLVIQLGIQLAKGITAAHREQIVHRDLKPANLRMTSDGQLKILDFGLAGWREPVNDIATTMTQASPDGILGTLPYMAPEQVRCEPVDHRTDIWGAGAVLYELATGQRPFRTASGLKLIDDIQHLVPPAPSTLNPQIAPALDTIILKALDKDPERRYQSADELGVDLARMLPPSAATITEFVPHKSRSRSSIWIVVVIIALIGTYAGYRLRKAWNPPQGRRLLTVLPFDSAGQDDRTSALIAGLTQTLTAKLAEMGGQDLQLISAREVRAQNVKTAEQAWREFGSDLVLEGNVHRIGDQIRINCSVVDSKTHRQLTARTITAGIQDAFGLEDQVSNEITSLLTQDQGIRIKAASGTRPANNPEAYANYLRGRGYLLEYQKPENIDLAIAELKNAIALDPEYASAYAALGQAYLSGYEQTNRGSDWIDEARRYCQKSLAIRETADGHICLGGVNNTTGKYDLGVRGESLDSGWQ